MKNEKLNFTDVGKLVVFRALQSSFLLMEMYMGRWLLIHEEVLMMLPRNYR